MKTTAGDIIILHMCTKNHNYMRYSSRDTEWVRQKNLSFWVIFCPFTPLTTWKTKILKKMKKVSFYTSVPKIMIICYMLLEIWSARHNFLLFWIIFCPFIALYWPWKKIVKKPRRYYPFTHVYHKWKSYDAWFLRYKGTRDRVFSYLGPFFALWPPNNPKNQIFEKMENTPGDIIILH